MLCYIHDDIYALHDKENWSDTDRNEQSKRKVEVNLINLKVSGEQEICLIRCALCYWLHYYVVKDSLVKFYHLFYYFLSLINNVYTK